MAAMTCPYCDRERTPATDECGGEGEGICGVYAAVLDGFYALPFTASDDEIRIWVLGRVESCELDAGSVEQAITAIAARLR